jgi:hypothetical protein
VFPNAKHSQASLRQSPVIPSIAALISLNLCGPIAAVDSPVVRAPPAAVPIATIAENDESRGGEYKIRLAGKAERVHLPATKASTDEHCTEAALSAFGATFLYCTHTPRVRRRHLSECTT